MNFKKISDNCFYFHDAVNIGYVRNGKYGLLIDSGIDASAAKKVLRVLNEHDLPCTHLFLTHAHADHYGGAAHLQKKIGVYTLAPFFEEAIMRCPKLEPLYLFEGVNPPEAMRNKFLEGAPVRVDQVCDAGTLEVAGLRLELIDLPGHSHAQLGVLVDDILYAADGYFSKETLIKHRIPFMVDVSEGIQSLQKLLSVDCKGAVPGHGGFEESFCDTVQFNLNFHKAIADKLLQHIRSESGGMSHEQIIRSACLSHDVRATSVSSWTLYRTAVTAYLLYLIDEGQLSMALNDFQLWFTAE
ncbi:MAG TPA: MBL fold metallo-hydrolase [Bacillales bacterium]|nr:MBL fold metallo-hydrolase [Bacillales bacterium]